jgi:hypothetical protein
MTEDEVFEWAVGTGLQWPEVQKPIKAGSLTEEGLRNAARVARPEVLAAARREQRLAQELSPPWSRQERRLRTTGAAAVLTLGLGSIFASLYLPFGWWKYLAAAAVAVLGAIASAILRPGWYDTFSVRPHEARYAWVQALIMEGVLPLFRAEINSLETIRATELSSTDSRGLFGGRPLATHQRTPAGERLAGLVKSVTGGSFALAGPRGCGKTNLLRAFCAGSYATADQPADLTVFAAAPVEYVPREFLLHLYAECCRMVIARKGPLVKTAKAGLDKITYVRTHSLEHSGKFGFKGAEYGAKQGLSLVGRAPTYPEVVNDFREFIRRAAESFAPSRVVIAIDEIDRIGTGESARRFLNELKAIFDVPGCFYLVSVSTEAQHDFELSGMGLRSVFDSSFDEVVRVEYLDFDLAKKLLGRLVIGLPEQFVALAHVFSGGLARQLIRVARDVLRQPQGTALCKVAGKLADDERDRVCETTSDALVALDDRAGVTELLQALMERRTDLQGLYEGESKAVHELRDLAAARIRFLEVVRQVFASDQNEATTREIDELAKARRYVGSNPVTGLELLEKFSSAWTARPAPKPQPQ